MTLIQTAIKNSVYTKTALIRLSEFWWKYLQITDNKERKSKSQIIIRPEDYLDFREYVINEFIHYKDYPEFYEQFNLGMHPPKQMSSTQIIGIMHHLRIVGHWCIKMGFTTNRSCDAFTIPAAVQGTPFYLTIEKRDKVYNASLHNKSQGLSR